MKALGKRAINIKQKNTDWWSEDIEQVVLEKRGVFNIWLTTHDVEGKRCFPQCCYKVGKSCREREKLYLGRR